MKENFKHIVGAVTNGEVASIKLFGYIDEHTANSFNSEFSYLEEYVKPSRIDILINSEGGRVLYGMSIFSIIQNSKIPTRCVNEGLAASTASVILMAGDETYAKDYSIIMIHKPFQSAVNEDDESQAVKAFRQQLETIYTKRFGMSLDEVQKIMEGEDGEDGTYFSADEAVKAGILHKDNIIATKSQFVNTVAASMGKMTNIADVQSMFSELSHKSHTQFKPSSSNETILNQTRIISEQDKPNINKDMNKNTEKVDGTIGLIEASLAEAMGVNASDSMALHERVRGLVDIEARFSELQKEKDELAMTVESKDQSIQNLQASLDEVKASLDVFKQKEEEARLLEIESVVNAAVADGRIAKDSKDKWVDMAKANFDTAKELLNGIQAREVISESIAKDPENKEKAKESMATVEALIEKVVGEDFQFLKSNK